MGCLYNQRSSPESIQRNPPEERGEGGLLLRDRVKEQVSVKRRAAEESKERRDRNGAAVRPSCFYGMNFGTCFVRSPSARRPPFTVRMMKGVDDRKGEP